MKKTLPELKPALNQMPGYGLLTLQGWESPALSLDCSYEVCVQRNQDSRFLGADGQWTATQTWHQVDATESQNEFVALTLGPSVVDPLVENPQMTYLLQARYGQELAQGVVRIREGVLSSHASGQTGEAVSRIAKPAQAAVPELSTTESESAPVGVPDPSMDPVGKPTPKSSPALLIAVIVVVLVLLAAYFGWRWYQNQQQVPAATTASTTTSAPVAVSSTPPVAVAACSSEALAATKDDLLFIQACLKTTPDTAQVLTVIELAKTAKRCDVAQRLYAFKGQAGDVVIALAYAKEFDPKFFIAGCVTAADKNTALYWYDLVLAKDANHAEAKERADALRK